MQGSKKVSSAGGCVVGLTLGGGRQMHVSRKMLSAGGCAVYLLSAEASGGVRRCCCSLWQRRRWHAAIVLSAEA